MQGSLEIIGWNSALTGRGQTIKMVTDVAPKLKSHNEVVGYSIILIQPSPAHG